MRHVWLAAFAAMLAATPTCALAANFCSDIDQQRADQLVYEVGSWRDLYIFYQHFEACGDNALTIGLADRVSDLLANHWETLDRLQDLVSDHPKFGDYVFEHVDTLMRPDQAKAILDSVHNRCPSASAALCKRIETGVNKVLPHLWGSGG